VTPDSDIHLILSSVTFSSLAMLIVWVVWRGDDDRRKK
jgi:hypothetical protein